MRRISPCAGSRAKAAAQRADGGPLAPAPGTRGLCAVPSAPAAAGKDRGAVRSFTRREKELGHARYLCRRPPRDRSQPCKLSQIIHSSAVKTPSADDQRAARIGGQRAVAVRCLRRAGVLRTEATAGQRGHPARLEHDSREMPEPVSGNPPYRSWCRCARSIWAAVLVVGEWAGWRWCGADGGPTTALARRRPRRLPHRRPARS